MSATMKNPVCPIPGKPCRVPDRSQGRVVGWPTLEEKAQWLDGAASLDALRAGLQRLSQAFGERTADRRTRQIHRWVRDQIRYINDFRVSTNERGEEFADPESLIVRGYGDCDDKARCFVALVRAAEITRPMGARARIRPVFRRHPYEFVHVQAEVRWPHSEFHQKAMPGGWLLAELILYGCEIGQDPDEMPRDIHGQRRIA
jgi:hypothetical protein